MTDKRPANSDELRWMQTQKALEAVEAGQYIDESCVNEWLESWSKDNELDPPKS